MTPEYLQCLECLGRNEPELGLNAPRQEYRLAVAGTIQGLIGPLLTIKIIKVDYSGGRVHYAVIETLN